MSESEKQEAFIRLAAAGAVGASVVHELRNALAVVSSSLYLARRDRSDEDKLLRHLDQATSEVIRAQAVAAAVLGLARGDALARETVEVQGLLNAARRAIVLPTNVTFAVKVSPPDLRVTADPVLLERLLVNLYQNAVDAMQNRGRGAITTEVSEGRSGVRFCIKDDGPGLPETAVGDVFEPLVTTKAEGTGLGLALVRAIAEAHHGSVTTDASLGPGACFLVDIPG